MITPAPYRAAPGGEWWGVLTDIYRRVGYRGLTNEGTAVAEVLDTVYRTEHGHLPEDERAEGGYDGDHEDVRTSMETLHPHQIVNPFPYRMAPDRELWDDFADIDRPRGAHGVINEQTAVGGTLATVYRSGRDHSHEDESRAIHPGTGRAEYRHDHRFEDTEGLPREGEIDVYQQYQPQYLTEARRQRELLREEMDSNRRDQAAQIEREVEIDAYQQYQWPDYSREISPFREETLPKEETDAYRHDHAVETGREVEIDAYQQYHWPEHSIEATTPRDQTEAYRRDRIAQIGREVEMLSPILRSRFDADGRFEPRRHAPLPVRSDPAHLHDAEPRPEPRAVYHSRYDCIPRHGIPTDPMPGHPHWPECSEGSRRVDQGPLVCDFCEQWLPNFIWLCSGCGRRECSRCRMEHSARCGLGI
ncbi:MAG: hypothetical protein L6R38_005547 [Xanthoria sp. 2 TBL-2021]|nr:MAG: hypothetical protein L6R38_005547 [Xanthoria sp. 2 TBL-2021]